MSDSEETLKQEPTLTDVMNVLTDISKRLDAFEARFKAIDIQLEVVREGIIHNASRFDRMDANIYSVRSDISNLRADLRDLSEKRRTQDLALE